MPSMATVRVTGLAPPAVIPPPWRGTPTSVPLLWRERVGVRGIFDSAGFAFGGVIVTIGTGAWPMPRDPPFRTASGSFSKVRLHPGALKYYVVPLWTALAGAVFASTVIPQTGS